MVEVMDRILGRRGAAGEAGAGMVAVRRSEVSGEDEGAPVVCVTRDPRDTSFIGRLLLCFMGLLLITFVLGTIIVVLLLRKGERVVTVKDAAGNVTQIDGYTLGGAAGVKVETYQQDGGDMVFLARELARLIHNVDMTRRREDLKKVVGAMTEGAADQYSRIMAERGIVKMQREESWNATWKEQDFSVDPRDPMVVTIIGTQNVQRTVQGQEKRDAFQYSVRFRLAVDPAGKRDENMRTGFIVREFELKPINEAKTN